MSVGNVSGHGYDRSAQSGARPLGEPVTDDNPDAVTRLAVRVAAAMPLIAARIPAGSAAEFGRIAAPGGAPRFARSGLRPGPHRAPGYQEPPVLGALHELRQFLVERLLGALELAVPELGLAGAWEPPAALRGPLRGHFAYASAVNDGQSTATSTVSFLEQLRPGLADLALSTARELAGHPLIASLLAAPAADHAAASDAAVAPDEAAVAAAHGTAYLALAVAVASATLGELPIPRLPWTDGGAPAAVVGVAAGVASLLLRDAPMPDAYAPALLAKARAEYRLPVRASALITVADHCFALAEGGFPAAADFSGNGLVAVVPGGAVIRTGRAEGDVTVKLTVVDEEPELDEAGWDEIVEVSWHADAGQATVIGPHGPDDSFGAMHAGTPPWPGDYRLRVHAADRDEPDAQERYQLITWRAPAGPEIARKRTDRLGHQLRGERQPDRPDRPEAGYRWVDDTALSMGATITVITGATPEAALRAFGADPARPESLRALDEEVTESVSPQPWVTVLDVGTAVLAVEYNGWQGSDESILQQASASGRAASVYWNGAIGMTRRSFAQDGLLLASFEWLRELDDEDIDPSVTAALTGLDFDDPRYWVGAGLAAAERFTGYRVTAADVARIEAADVAYRIAAEP